MYYVSDDTDYPMTSLQYSLLDPGHSSATNCIENDNKDLEMILQTLEEECKAKKLSQLSQRKTAELLTKSLPVTVKPGSPTEIARPNQYPSFPAENTDPRKHIDRFYNDVLFPQPLPPWGNEILTYPVFQPENENHADCENHHSNVSLANSDEAFKNLLPDFVKLGFSINSDEFSSAASGGTGTDDEAEEQNVFANFNEEKATEEVIRAYIPDVVSSDTDSRANSVQSRVTVSTSNSHITETPNPGSSSYSVSERVESITIDDEDELFKSGSPPKFSTDHLGRLEALPLETIQENAQAVECNREWPYAAEGEERLRNGASNDSFLSNAASGRVDANNPGKMLTSYFHGNSMLPHVQSPGDKACAQPWPVQSSTPKLDNHPHSLFENRAQGPYRNNQHDLPNTTGQGPISMQQMYRNREGSPMMRHPENPVQAHPYSGSQLSMQPVTMPAASQGQIQGHSLHPFGHASLTMDQNGNGSRPRIENVFIRSPVGRQMRPHAINMYNPYQFSSALNPRPPVQGLWHLFS